MNTMITSENNLGFILEDMESKLLKARQHEYNNMINNPFQLRFMNKYMSLYRGIGNTTFLLELAIKNDCYLVVPTVAQAQQLKKDSGYQKIYSATEFLTHSLKLEEDYIVDSIFELELEAIVASKNKNPIAGLVIY